MSFEFGGRWLYRGVDWQISPGERIGLVGRNGSGKTTLFRLMVGEYRPTEGTISRAANLKIGYLDQDLRNVAGDEPIVSVAMRAFDDALRLEGEIEALLSKIESGAATTQELELLAEKQEAFAVAGGYEMEARAHEILDGLGFSPEQRMRSYRSFSGGWRMRVLLAQILLRRPDLLLLDEPTNHLDLPSIRWVENYIRDYDGAVVVVSHDRHFLDQICSKIVEISSGKLHHYTGNYSQYLTQKEERKAIQKAAYENQQREIRKTQQLIERFRAQANKAAQAQSWIKQLERMELVDEPEAEEATMNVRFPPAPKSGADVLTISGVVKRYGDETVLEDANAVVRRGDKIGLVGANGTGKSTALKILAGAVDFEGRRIEGYNVRSSFFAQHQIEVLDPSLTVLEEVMRSAHEKNETRLRTVLGAFLFRGDEVDKKIGVLSGGERSRVALAKALLSESNLLLLDEPTNHLDIQSIKVLAQALRQYDGTYVVVSHDRYFLGETTDKIWYIENRQIKEYPGGYRDFEQWQNRRANTPTSNGAPTRRTVPKTENGSETKADDPRKRSRLRVQKIESEIEAWEAKKTALESELSTSLPPERLHELAEEYRRVAGRIDELMVEWEKALQAAGR
ncbi:MAG: ABC-F family ATP-binding cassette domain-containing protein [Bacteroidia bacterium]|nr:ABC-F family ATP-binding cassette domain-containing protein [Bacteroidia bacterium]